MTDYLRVQDGVAVEVLSIPAGRALTDVVHPDLASDFHPKGKAQVGWLLEGETFKAPPATVLPAQDLAAYARARSYTIRTNGTTINGVAVRTDAESLVLVSGMTALAEREPDRVFNYDTGSSIASFNAAAVLALGQAMGSWVQDSFDRRAEVIAAIKAGQIKTIPEVEAALGA